MRAIRAGHLVGVGAGFGVAALLAAGWLGGTRVNGSVVAPPDDRSAARAYGALPISFEPNVGQAEPQVEFVARGRGYTLLLGRREALLALQPSANASTDVLRMRLIGGNPKLHVAGLERLPGKANYLIGNDPKRWLTNLPTYAKVRYSAVYPGIDLLYYGKQGRLEYDLLVRPGADPRLITISFPGAGRISLERSGDLLLRLDGGQVRLLRPFVYQQLGGRKQVVAGRFVLRGARRVGFELGAYDASKLLVIDPGLVYSTYLGGSADDSGLDVAVDATGNAYVTGGTASLNFPTSSPLQPSYGGGTFDAYVAKIDASGSALVYSTYLGGSAFDQGLGVAVDAAGNAHITGQTNSANFPTASATQPTFGGDSDAFVVKLNASGSALVYSTYLGGSNSEDSVVGSGDIAVDGDSAYVTGETSSSDFPTLSALQATKAGFRDAFVGKFASDGTLAWSTYLGGGPSESADNVGSAIAVDGAGNVYVAGSTNSAGFPTQSPLQASLAGATDAFVTKIDSAGSALLYSTYLGGTGSDAALGVAVDAAGNAYATGETSSGNVPTAAPFQPTNGGGLNDAFVTKLNASGSSLVYSTYLGGSSFERGWAVAVDGSGSAHVAGQTSSANFPIVNAAQATLGGGTADAFATKLTPSGSALVYSTYLGGSDFEVGGGVAADGAGDTYVFGHTFSTDFPTSNPLQAANGGALDAFLSKVQPAEPGISINDVAVVEGDSGTVDAVFTVTLSTPSSDPVTVAFVIADGSATAGSDYLPALGILVFPLGTTAQTVTVVVLGDTLDEPDETFFVNLSSPTGATIADGVGVGTILNDEPLTPGVDHDVGVAGGGFRTKGHIDASRNGLGPFAVKIKVKNFGEASEDIFYDVSSSEPGTTFSPSCSGVVLDVPPNTAVLVGGCTVTYPEATDPDPVLTLTVTHNDGDGGVDSNPTNNARSQAIVINP